MKDYFIYETQAKTWCNGLIPTETQIGRWLWMKNNILNPIREHLKMPVHISDCLRNQASYERLVKKGYSPSPKSDHFAGTPIFLTKQKHIVQFGKIYTFSTFACDIDGEFDHKKLCKDIFLTVNALVPKGHDRFVNGFSEYGVEQLILESQERKGNLMTWIHIAAPLEAFFSKN